MAILVQAVLCGRILSFLYVTLYADHGQKLLSRNFFFNFPTFHMNSNAEREREGRREST